MEHRCFRIGVLQRQIPYLEGALRGPRGIRPAPLNDRGLLLGNIVRILQDTFNLGKGLLWSKARRRQQNKIKNGVATILHIDL